MQFKLLMMESPMSCAVNELQLTWFRVDFHFTHIFSIALSVLYRKSFGADSIRSTFRSQNAVIEGVANRWRALRNQFDLRVNASSHPRQLKRWNVKLFSGYQLMTVRRLKFFKKFLPSFRGKFQENEITVSRAFRRVMNEIKDGK